MQQDGGKKKSEGRKKKKKKKPTLPAPDPRQAEVVASPLPPIALRGVEGEPPGKQLQLIHAPVCTALRSPQGGRSGAPGPASASCSWGAVTSQIPASLSSLLQRLRRCLLCARGAGPGTRGGPAGGRAAAAAAGGAGRRRRRRRRRRRPRPRCAPGGRGGRRGA